MEAIREPLADNGLSVNQGAKPDGTGNIVIETLVSHTSGEWIQTETFIPIEKADPQKAGAAITYGRRYALELFFCMSAEDDDGNTASGNKPSVSINFKSIEKQFDACKSQEEVKSLIGKFEANAGQANWTPKQLEDVKNIGRKRYKELDPVKTVEDKFQGEQQ